MEEKLIEAPPEQVDLPKPEEENLLPSPHHATPKLVLILLIALVIISLIAGAFLYLR